MPADYLTTAKALALPISPIASPTPEQQSARPPWSRSPSSRQNHTNPYSQSSRTPLNIQLLNTAAVIQRRIRSTFSKLSPLQRILVLAAGVAFAVFGILFLIYNEKIFGALAPAAKRWRDIRGGWMIIWSLTFISAFPPLIGYSTTITISGFVYGFPHGWFIVASATVAGSLASFLASRTILSKYVHRLVGQDKRFEALALTLKHDGLKILCMIRFCPLPYSLSNAAMSTFPTVHPLSFALATLISSPKLLIHVFIGSRMAAIGERGENMDASTKAINWASIIIGGTLGVAVGYIIYQRTMARAAELEVEELEAGTNTGVQRERVYSDEGRGGSGGGGEEGGIDVDAAALMNDDDISLWDHNANGGYSDELDEDDVFVSGDGRGR
ncbi:Golgi apparatus membrane protein tvp38 [Calycina marina]|uniref:Golgi apparatus membrane protein TVP38 n=1 Tax=Calycina marina TaxID=1763456 RepID=A0A9P7ZBD0_9HELO|nr:Golgi apparatus membrane protein tvp38 [Calycina marina]